MLYPNHYSSEGYCRKLITEYQKIYITLTEQAIRKTINYIVPMVAAVLKQNKTQSLNEALQFLVDIATINENKYLTLIEILKPTEDVVLLYCGAQKPEVTAEIIESRVHLTIDPVNRKEYLEFIKTLTINCAKELSILNQPKPKKNVTINDDVDTGTFGAQEEARRQDKEEESDVMPSEEDTTLLKENAKPSSNKSKM